MGKDITNAEDIVQRVDSIVAELAALHKHIQSKIKERRRE